MATDSLFQAIAPENPSRKKRGSSKMGDQNSEAAASTADLYISPSEIASRWSVSRSTVARAAKEAGFRPFRPGKGRNSPIRFLLREIIQYERAHTITASRS